MEMMLEQFKTIFDRPEKVKKLREMILDLAVRGKLVEQDPNDEPASVLLERIKEEKERLIKEKKIKKEKALAEISDKEKEVFSGLPQSWNINRFGNIFLIKSSKRVFEKDYVTNGVPFFRSKEIGLLEQHKYINSEKHISLTKYKEIKKDSEMPKSGDLLVTSVGSVGNSWIVDEREFYYKDGNITQICGNENINIKYVQYFIKSKIFISQINNTVSGTAYNALTIVKFKNMIISIPPLQEQKRIVQKVDFLMSFCDKLEEALEKKVHYGELCAKSIFNSIGNVSTSEELEKALKFILANFKDISLGDNAVKELKNCILQLAVQGKLVEQDPSDEPASVLLEKISEEKERLIKEKKIKKEKALAEIREEEKPFELPDGWCFTRLNNLTTKIGAGSTPKGGKSVYLDSGIKFIRSQNVYNNGLFINDVAYIDEKTHEKMSGSKVEANDLLINITGGSIGRCCIVPSEFDTGNVNQHVSIVRLIDNEILKYIHLVLTSPYIFNKIMEVQVGISREGLSISKLSEFIIPFPPLSEQKRIVEKVDSLMALCDELENKIQEQKKYSNMLMESILKNSFSK